MHPIRGILERLAVPAALITLMAAVLLFRVQPRQSARPAPRAPVASTTPLPIPLPHGHAAICPGEQGAAIPLPPTARPAPEDVGAPDGQARQGTFSTSATTGDKPPAGAREDPMAPGAPPVGETAGVLTPWDATDADPRTESKNKASLQQEMVFVPAGEFLMGDPEANAGHQWDRYNVRHTSTTGAYWIDKYEVTNAMFKEFLDVTKYRGAVLGDRLWWGDLVDHWKDGTYPEGTGNKPVRNVSYDDACAFAGWAVKRLPTNEEWDKAGRGTDGRLTPWGGRKYDRDGRCAHIGLDIQADEVFDVDAFPTGASPYGVLNMEGNIAEWTSSRVDSYQFWEYDVIVRNGLMSPIAVSTRAHHVRPMGVGFRCVRDATPEEAAQK